MKRAAKFICRLPGIAVGLPIMLVCLPIIWGFSERVASEVWQDIKRMVML
jgi:hypothetical protein